jgi:hypothetical protein
VNEQQQHWEDSPAVSGLGGGLVTLISGNNCIGDGSVPIVVRVDIALGNMGQRRGSIVK